MKIVETQALAAVGPILKDIDYGDCFQISGVTFLKCRPKSLDDAFHCIVVNVEDGTMLDWPPSTPIDRVNAELHIEQK